MYTYLYMSWFQIPLRLTFYSYFRESVVSGEYNNVFSVLYNRHFTKDEKVSSRNDLLLISCNNPYIGVKSNSEYNSMSFFLFILLLLLFFSF